MVELNNIKKMCEWEKQKAFFLLLEATKLGMDIEEYGKIGVNINSGYTYLWIEDYSFTLYMPIECELKKEEIYAIWTNTENGEEKERKLEKNTTLEQIYEWEKEIYEEFKETENE